VQFGQTQGAFLLLTLFASDACVADRIEAVRRELDKANISAGDNQIECMELLGEGTYGKVYKGG
jgi:hypothetical protein